MMIWECSLTNMEAKLDWIVIWWVRRKEYEKRPCVYSEQKNCHTKGQISLVRQFAAQLTKIYPWEIRITKVDILSFDVPSNKHLSSFVDFILTLRWDPLDVTVFLHTVKLALQIHITWLNLKYYVNWPSTIQWLKKLIHTRSHFSLEAGCTAENKAKPIWNYWNKAFYTGLVCA